MKFFFIGFICLAMLNMASSCTSDSVIDEEETGIDNGNQEEPEEDDYEDTGDEELVPNSQNVAFDNAVTITFGTSGATVDNPFEGSGVTVTNNNGHVTIQSTITDTELNYVLSGVIANGSVKIYGEYKFGLVLNGVGITNPTGGAINIQCGKKITVTVVDQTNNRLIDGTTYTYTDGEDMKGTFFSEGQLNFYGNGALEIRGKNKHAICTDDYFRMYEGNITVIEAASDAVHANDYIIMEGGTLTTRSTGEGLDCEKGYIQIKAGTLSITTTGDAYYDTEDADISSSTGIKAETDLLIDGGTITVKSFGQGGKGISVDGALTINDGTVAVTTTGGQFVYGSDDTAAKAIKADGDLTINGGTITIKTSGVEAEGLESKASLYIHGGTVEISAYDDAINATTHIEITGGNVYCNSTVNDAIDSNGTLTISGGVIVAAGATSPEGGIDCDNSRFSITGGTIIGLGGASSTPTASACTQRSLVYGFSSSNVKIIRIEATSEGEEALTLELPRTYNSMVMLFSSEKLKASTGYTVYTGGAITGGTSFHGYYTGATYTKGTQATTFTTSSMVTSAGSTGGGGGGRP